MRIDVHQHIWTPELRAALTARDQNPLIREEHGVTTLYCAGEHPYVIDTASEAAAERTALLDLDANDAAIIAISSPIGIEALPHDEALALIDAQLQGVKQLGPRFSAWAPLPTDRPTPEDVDQLVKDHTPAGISIASNALGTPERLEQLHTTLAHIAELELPLFIHPGNAIGDTVPGCPLDEPLYWRALTTYVNQMQAAWLSFATHGRREHPDLTVIFAMLAGLAPLQSERLVTRGGPQPDLADPLTFYDTSSYGIDAVNAFTRSILAAQLLYGSDRPVLEPLTTPHDVTFKTNGGRLFGAHFRARGVTAKLELAA